MMSHQFLINGLWQGCLDLLSGLFEIFLQPFTSYVFMRKALVGCCALSLSCGPLGCLMVLRRLSLVGDALSHGLLPGIGIAFLVSGFSIIGLSIGGMIAGLCMAWGATVIQAKTTLSEDSTFAACFTLSMAFGLLILSAFGNNVDIMHILLGTVLAISQESLVWICTVSSVSLILITVIYRPLVLRAFDLAFFESIGGKTQRLDLIFMVLVTINLVSAFQALGTLMALGLLLLPAITARLFCRQVWTLALTAVLLSATASYLGLVLAYHLACPCGPAIVLTAGVFYLGALTRYLKPKVRLVSAMILLIGGGGGARLLLSSGVLHTAPHAPIITSFNILADFAHELAGPDISVTSLLGPGSDPHAYEPSPRDLVRLLKAKVVIINGLTLEKRWLQHFLKRGNFKGQLVVASDGCQVRVLTMGNTQITDPHAWQDVANGRIYVANISRALAQAFPHHAPAITQRAQAYDAQLKILDIWIRRQISRLPPSRKCILTTHDGLGYFAQTYGLECLSPWGLSTDTEPSAKEVAVLITHARQRGVKVVFLENILSPRLMHQIAHTERMSVGGTLYVDGLSDTHGPASTYIDMMTHNTQTLLKGLLTHT